MYSFGVKASDDRGETTYSSSIPYPYEKRALIDGEKRFIDVPTNQDVFREVKYGITGVSGNMYQFLDLSDTVPVAVADRFITT
ncbi:MAG: hypothetical protein LBD75_02970 [Candidatus Peribacteria bacterium]|jgi:hypothetical protein|nr:hypothetical protein [Candidatus Peribacteria bacterium]